MLKEVGKNFRKIVMLLRILKKLRFSVVYVYRGVEKTT